MATEKSSKLSPFVLLCLMGATMSFGYSGWATIIRNYTVDGLGLGGKEIGLQESLREIPGFLSFTAIFIILVIKEQRLAVVMLAITGLGIAITGFFSSALGLYFTTILMSIGFHYFEVMNQSLALQWLPKATAAQQMGKIIAVVSASQLVAYGIVLITDAYWQISFTNSFLLLGSLSLLGSVAAWLCFPVYKQQVLPSKGIVLRRRYWLFYALTFMSGARRQIFTVFASLLMVQKFNYEVHDVALLFIINCLINMSLASYIGKLIGRVGERRALTIEYVGLLGVFITYAFVESPMLAAGLYVIDHMFFAFAIAIKTYFQKIAEPADIAPTTSVAFTINHIAAVSLPMLFGLLWMVSPAAVFLCGAAIALASLLLSRLVPLNPDRDNEVNIPRISNHKLIKLKESCINGKFGVGYRLWKIRLFSKK